MLDNSISIHFWLLKIQHKNLIQTNSEISGVEFSQKYIGDFFYYTIGGPSWNIWRTL